MQYDILTIFPNIFDSYINESILGRAQKNKKIKINIHDIRKNATDKHGTVDDKPYGGGPGMVMMVEPIYKTLKKIKLKKNCKTILLSAKGNIWTQQKAKRYKNSDQLILICGHYEGVDERVKNFIDEEISIGDYVLTGGELPALVLIDSTARLIPEVLGKKESLKEESHYKKGYVEYPQYTRPEIFEAGKKKYKVPEILLSGHHAKIKKWREKHAKNK